MTIYYSSLATKNLRDYIIYATKISNWEIHKFNNIILTINGSNQSLFNYAFCMEKSGEYCINSVQEVLSYLQERKIEATWPIDPHVKTRFKLENLGIKNVSTPKKAFLDMKNYLLPQDTVPNLKLDIVNSKEDLIELDKKTSVIFHHDIGIVSTFLRGLSNYDQASGLKFFLAKLNGEVVGTCGIYIQDKIAGLYSDGVLPLYRNQGIATQMIIQRIKIARQYGCDYVIAHCMKLSINLYKRMGFKMLGNLYLHVSST